MGIHQQMIARWELKELARKLRKDGLSYNEISVVICNQNTP